MYLLNTDVIFDLLKPEPNDNLLEWCNLVAPERMHISVLSIGILKRDLDNFLSIQQKSLILCWLKSHFIQWINNNVIHIDTKISERWADLQTTGKNSADSLIAATAVEKGLILTTGLKRYEVEGLKIFNPFV